MSLTQVIPLAAIIATPSVTDGPQQRVLWGGELGIKAVELCLQDHRDINAGFFLQRYDGPKGLYEVNCQVMETQQGPYYAAKGVYRSTPVLKTLLDMFSEFREIE